MFYTPVNICKAWCVCPGNDPASLADVEDRLLPLALALVRAGDLPALLEEYKQVCWTRVGHT